MLRFLARRIIFALSVGLLILFSVHLGMGMIRNSEISQPELDWIRQVKAAWFDTRSFMEGWTRDELGSVSVPSGSGPIRQILKESYVNSMGLVLVSLFGGAAIGLTAGTLAALSRKNRYILPLFGLTILGIATPSFFAGLLLRQGELAYVRAFGRPLVSMAGFAWDYQHMLLPALVLAARPLAYLTRSSYLSVSRAMEEDYIRTAFSKGLSLPRTVNVHALRNVAVPLLTAVGVSLRFSLSTLPVVEFFFVWPGMGLRLLEGIDGMEPTLVAGLAVALGLTFLGVNVLLDFAYRLVDPRLRENDAID
jgi:peptide/nickel transport system permease protein